VDSSGDPLPLGARARLGTLRFHHHGQVSFVALSPDGKLAATAGVEGDVSLWEVPGGKRRAIFSGSGVTVIFLAFSHDGRTLAASDAWSASGEVRLWDTSRGRLLHTLPVPAGMTRLAFAPDGQTLAGPVTGEGVRFWDVRTGKKVRMLADPSCQAGVAWAAGGNTLAWGRGNGAIVVWDLRAGRVRHLLPGHREPPLGLAFSPDGRTLASNSPDGTLRVWDVGRGAQTRRIDIAGGRVPEVAFVDRGKAILAVTHGKCLRRWVLPAGAGTSVWEDRSGDIGSIAFSLDGRTALVGSLRGSHCPRLVDLVGNKMFPVAPDHGREVSCLAFSCDGKLLATGTRGEPLIRLWDSAGGRLQRVLAGPADGVTALSFSPDGKILASAGLWDRTVRLSDVASGRIVRTLSGHEATVSCLAFSPDGKSLASGTPSLRRPGSDDSDGMVRLWDVRTGRLLKELKGIGGTNSSLGFLCDGQTLVTGGDSIRIWDLAGQTVLRALEGNGPFALSPDGRLLAHAGKTELVLLEALTLAPLFRRTIPSPDPDVLALSPGGELLALAGKGLADIRVWDAIRGKELGILKGHAAGGVSALAFSPDSRTLASGGFDATALLWDSSAFRRLPPTNPGSPLNPARAWRDLGSNDPGRAYRAIRLLTRDPARAVRHIALRLTPVSHAEANRLKRLVADLDADDFAVRQRASAELTKAGSTAQPFLRAALAGKPSLELHHRAERLLLRLQSAGLDEKELRVRRAVVVLERIDSAAARQVLLQLAGGAPWAPLTQDAADSLRRMVRRRPHP
jgi:WD40 repeat protein